MRNLYITDQNMKKRRCGLHDRGMPEYTYTYCCPRALGEIDGQEVKFIIHPNPWKRRINFEFDGEAWYFDDDELSSKIYKQNRWDAEPFELTFVAEYTERKLKAKLPYEETLKFFGGRTEALVSNSKVAKGETNDCTVKALMECMQIPYDRAHRMLRPYRRDRKGCHMYQVLKYQREFIPLFSEETLPKKMTLGTFIKDYTRKADRYVVIVSGHAFCVADQKIYDGSQIGLGRKVQNVFRYKKQIRRKEDNQS